MAEVDYAFLCDFVRVEDGLGYVVAAGIDTIYPETVPSGANLGLAIRLLFSQGECGRPHRVEIIVQGEDGGEPLVRIEATVEPEWRQELPIYWRANTFLGLNFGVPLPRHGTYSVEILLDDSHRKTLNFRVAERPKG